MAPVPRPPSFLAIARNYDAHVRELGHERPELQTWFSKQPTCVIGPGAAIEVPRVSDAVDYEGELGLVIGRRCRHVPAGRALEVVAGVTVVNDVSVRDWQWRTPTMMMGKGFDTHGPTGPWIVTVDEVEDLQDLAVRTWVNGELRQDGRTADMIFTCAQMIEHLSEAFTLEPGMLITTGTPAGVAAGQDPPRWLSAGDTVTVEVEGVGRAHQSGRRRARGPDDRRAGRAVSPAREPGRSGEGQPDAHHPPRRAPGAVQPERRPRRTARQQGQHPGGAPFRHQPDPRRSDPASGPASSSVWDRSSGWWWTTSARRFATGSWPWSASADGWRTRCTWRRPVVPPGRHGGPRSGAWRPSARCRSGSGTDAPIWTSEPGGRAGQLTWRREPAGRPQTSPRNRPISSVSRSGWTRSSSTELAWTNRP